MKMLKAACAAILALALTPSLALALGNAGNSVGPASATAPGYVTTGTQTFAGNKTFLGTTSITDMTMSGAWTLTKTAESSAAETLATLSVSDDATAKLIIENASATNSAFLPAIRTIGNGANSSLNLISQGTTDTGTTALSRFNFRIGTSTAVVTRPLIDLRNNSTTVVSITAAGALSVSGGTAPAISTSGALTATGGIAAAGGFSTSPRNWHTGNNPASASTDGTDATPVNTEVYIAEIFVPANATITGVAVFNGSVASGNMKVGLANSSGTVVATSASTAMSGTDAYQRIAFTGTYAAVGPATYYVLQFVDNGTARIKCHTIGNFGASKQTGQTYATGFTTITPPTTFTTGIGPIASLY